MVSKTTTASNRPNAGPSEGRSRSGGLTTTSYEEVHISPDGTVTRGAEHLILRLGRVWRKDGDYSLMISDTGVVLAFPSHYTLQSSSLYTVGRSDTISVTFLQSLYDEDPDALLKDFEEVFGLPLGVNNLRVDYLQLFWRPGTSAEAEDVIRRAGMTAVRDAEARQLQDITIADLTDGTLPQGLREAGYEWVEGDRLPGMNPKRVIAGPSGSRYYLKQEENPCAAGAELIYSALLPCAQLRGVRNRTYVTIGGNLVISPELGGDRVSDLGSFADYFRSLGRESSTALQNERASVIVRVTLADLNLADPMEVARFVALNAIVGNTDRHSDNIHYGAVSDMTSPYGYKGVLLPLDHGRACFNNTGVEANLIAGSLAQAITGQVGGLSNPHQLLRPFVELMHLKRVEVREAIESTARLVREQCEQMRLDPAWLTAHETLRQISERASVLSAEADSFIDDVAREVRA